MSAQSLLGPERPAAVSRAQRILQQFLRSGQLIKTALQRLIHGYQLKLKRFTHCTSVDLANVVLESCEVLPYRTDILTQHLAHVHRPLHQAARTVDRKFSTSIFSLALSFDSVCADVNTWLEAEPVSDAPRCTSAMLEATCWVPCAACMTLREISWVAAPCSSTADAMVEEISEIRPIVPLISLIATTDSWVADCMAAIW